MASGKPNVIGGAGNFWLYSDDEGYDLTHPQTPEGPQVYPRISLKVDGSRAVIDPKKTALVIIDLQNYFLSPAFGRPSESLGLKVVDQLLENAIPAYRKASIPILWLRWGLTQEDIESMPPTILRGFGMDNNFEDGRKPPGLGTEVGPIKLEDGSTIDGAKTLMYDQWNSQIYAPLAKEAKPNDLCIYKNRLSGFWGGTGVEKALKDRGISTLIFSGCNTDQCVATSLTDAVSQSWDCLLLTDGCATTSPRFVQESVEFNMGGWGFSLTCKDLANSID